ncbi:MAG: TetR/AcrR family transcriptional regulator [Halioglobus sp.]|nr:TetR/AcrR family transcriptional regulator [Halioglobus sp.]
MKSGNSQGRGGSSSPFNRTAQHDAKRAAILSQAAQLFNYKGSRATTLRDIAESLGLTKTSLYYYVKTKEELIFQCYMATLAHHHKTLDEIEQQHASPTRRISHFYQRHFVNWLDATEGRGPHYAVLLEIAGLKGEHRERVEAQYIAMFKRLRGYLQAGIDTGEFRTCQPTLTTLAILGSVDWAFSWLHSIPRTDVLDAASKAVDLILHGIASQPGAGVPADLSPGATSDNTVLGFDRKEQNRLKQEAFFKTGTWFFNKKGFSGTSLDEIAEHLDVSKGAFYYHIKNKEDLLYYCYERSLDITARIHEQANATHSSGLERAAFVCRRVFLAQNSEEGPLVRYNSITALPMDRRQEILRRTDASNALFGDLLQQGVADGSVRDVDTYMAQQLIAGAMNAAMDIDLWYQVDDLDFAASEYFRALFDGLTVATPSSKDS